MADLSVSYQLWLQQCAQKKSLALQHLYEHEAPHLLALAHSLLHRNADATNLVRETFVLIWRNADNYDPKLGSAKAWIYSILRFKAQQHLKHNPTLSPFSKVKTHLIIPATASATLLKFQPLEDKSRKMLAMAYLQAYSYAEIAKECQNSIDLTQKQIHLALLKLIEQEQHWKNDSTEQVALLGAYCLGLLRDPQQQQQAHELLGQSSAAAQDLLLWEGLFSALVETLQPQMAPMPLLNSIYADLQLTIPSHSPSPESHQPTPPVKPAPELPESSRPVSPASRFDDTVASVSAEPLRSDHPAVTKSPDHNDVVEKNKPTQNTEQLAQKNAIHLATDELRPPAPELKNPESSESLSKPLHKIKNKPIIWALVASALLCLAVLIWALSPKAPVIQMVQMSPQAGAILQAPGQSSTPGWIVSIDAAGHVLLNPQVRTEIQADKSVQLWTQSPHSSEIRSLGLINPNQPITVPADVIGAVSVNQIFEMTLENKQGASQPSGPVLFIGRVVKFGDFQAPQQEQSNT